MLRVDDDRCIGCGLCQELLPQFFELVDGQVRVREADAAHSAESGLAEAVERCPGDAIFVD